jgi:Xaa-Pro aminopeptidase
MTRTYFTGEPTERFREIYHIVLDALERAEESIGPGFGLAAGDALARDHIGSHGYAEQFGHGLGHGVGLEIHEAPSLSFRVKDPTLTLKATQVVTIEPGIYLPGWGGVRIEDLALITEEGIEILTKTSKDVDAWRRGQS